MNRHFSIFDDVPPAIEVWARKFRVVVYSSGSIESQKLLFSYTTFGDMSAHVSNYFDLSIGSKTESSSYEKLARELAVNPGEVAYINDRIEGGSA